MHEHDVPEQLTLLPLPTSGAPLQFRLDAETRRRGLRHVAEIRRQLAARQAARSNIAQLPGRTPIESTAA